MMSCGSEGTFQLNSEEKTREFRARMLSSNWKMEDAHKCILDI